MVIMVCYGDLVPPSAAGLLGQELSLHILVGIDPLDGSGLNGSDLSGNGLDGNGLDGSDLSGNELDGSDLILKLSQKLEAMFDLLS